MMLGLDQYGHAYRIVKHPRKELVKQVGGGRVSKMYVDKTDGSVKQIGYVVGDHWIEVFKLQSAFAKGGE